MNEKTRVLIFDVDDTITKSRTEISDEMSSILNNIPIDLVFISGTTVSELKRMISSKLKRKHHILGTTGTHYVVIDDDEKVILNEKLTADEKGKIINALKRLKEKYNLISLTSEEDQIQDRGSQITLSILGRWAPLEKKYQYDPSKEKRINFVKFLRNFLDKGYEINIGGTTSIDITKKGKDKSWAIGNFMKINNFNKDEIIFFGDQLNPGGNDYPVIKTGIKCIEVKNPSETLDILQKFYKNKIPTIS